MAATSQRVSGDVPCDGTFYKPPHTNSGYALIDMDDSGFWCINHLCDSVVKVKDLKVREDDVFTVGFPKSGITWLNEIVYLLKNDLNKEKAKTETQEVRVPYMEYPVPGIAVLDTYPSPRILKTHVCFDRIPSGIKHGKGKLIYIIRNPKDVTVSLFHFMKFMLSIKYSGTFIEFAEEFLSGKVMYGPWESHVAGFLGNKSNANIHIVFYEALIKNPEQEVKTLAKFLGKSYNDRQIELLLHHCSFENLKNDDSANFSHLVKRGQMASDESNEGRVGLMRKGIVGDWKNYYTEELSGRVDKIMKEKLEPLGLTYSYDTDSWHHI